MAGRRAATCHTIHYGGNWKDIASAVGMCFEYIATDVDIISCFEHEYEKKGVHYMDIYVHAASVTRVDAYSTFS